MPGWQQIGAVWLPLPHVLNMIPVQVDAWYRSGASAIAISIASMALAAWSLASFVLRRTGSISAAVAGAVLLMCNPNVLFLQSTPMTEPLLFGTAFFAVAMTADWLDRGAPMPAGAAGAALIAACMTRYEAWPIDAVIVALALVVLLRRGVPPKDAALRTATLAAYPVCAILLFLANARWTTGSWLISSGFFVAENDAIGQSRLAWQQVREGVDKLSGGIWILPAYAGAALVAWNFVSFRARASMVLILALAAASVLPWYAYYEGHPLRIRYSVPLVVACAALSATGISLLHRWLRAPAAAALIALSLWHVSPLDRSAALIMESQRDAANRAGRQVVTDFLVQHRDGLPIMMSMGSLAHYMHDLAFAGFNIHDILHEGNGEIWVAAVQYGPRGYVKWVAIEEKAEGGDVLYQRAKQDDQFLIGFERVAEGGGVALYRAVR
jgi:hypothetical protein